MDKQYDNNNSGALFPNNRKEKETHPDLNNGSCEIEGKEFWFKAWKKTSKNGLPFLSVSFDPKEAAPVVSSGVAPTNDDPIDF